jgi:hypothetical protein
MPDEVTIIVQPIGQVSVTISGAPIASSTGADGIPYDNSGTDITATTVGDAIDELAGDAIAQASAPSSGVQEGDVWYDTDDDVYYIRKNSDWVSLLDSQSTINIDGGTF